MGPQLSILQYARIVSGNKEMHPDMQNWDGSGGNGAAVRHFEATGKKYPLAVKLGTITPHGADVFSYAEDEMVTDPKLVCSSR